MSLKVKDRAKPSVPPVDPGVYMAACVGVIDLGKQYSEKFKNYSDKIMLSFELIGETVEIDGEQKPRQISRIFTFAKGARSGLRKFLQSWDGVTLNDEQMENEDLSQRLGRTCQLQIVLNETKDKANIDNIMALPKGLKLDKPQSEMILFDLDEFDQATFDKLSEWTQETIKKSRQWANEHASTETIEAKDTADGLNVQSDPATGEIAEQGPVLATGGTESGRQSAVPTGGQIAHATGGVPF